MSDTERTFIIAAEILGFDARYDEDKNQVIATHHGRGHVSFTFATRPPTDEDDRIRYWVRDLQRTIALDGATPEQALSMLEKWQEQGMRAS